VDLLAWLRRPEVVIPSSGVYRLPFRRPFSAARVCRACPTPLSSGGAGRAKGIGSPHGARAVGLAWLPLKNDLRREGRKAAGDVAASPAERVGFGGVGSRRETAGGAALGDSFEKMARWRATQATSAWSRGISITRQRNITYSGAASFCDADSIG
jgi:hypothetical protein